MSRLLLSVCFTLEREKTGTYPAGSRHHACRNAYRLRRKLCQVSVKLCRHQLHRNSGSSIPFPLTVTGVIELPEALGLSGPAGVAAARAPETATKAAKVFMVDVYYRFSSNNLLRRRKARSKHGKIGRNGERLWVLIKKRTWARTNEGLKRSIRRWRNG
jgi:hypothetical protein